MDNQPKIQLPNEQLAKKLESALARISLQIAKLNFPPEDSAIIKERTFAIIYGICTSDRKLDPNGSWIYAVLRNRIHSFVSRKRLNSLPNETLPNSSELMGLETEQFKKIHLDIYNDTSPENLYHEESIPDDGVPFVPPNPFEKQLSWEKKSTQFLVRCPRVSMNS